MDNYPTQQKGGHKYGPDTPEQARKLCKLGATDMDLADFFGVVKSTINMWKVKHPEFNDALVLGKDAADKNVEQSLYHRAIGYSHPDVDIKVIDGQIVQTEIIKHYPPDTKAAVTWLYNRKRDDWSIKPGAEQTQPDTEITINLVDAKKPDAD